MKAVRCLYVDDDENQQRYVDWFSRAWNEVGASVPLEIVCFTTPDAALQEIAERAQEYQLLIADLLFGPQNAKLGLAVIESASHHPHLAILAFSIGNGGLERLAKDNGAQEYLSKHLLIDKRLKTADVGYTLLSVLRERNYDPITATLHLELHGSDDDLHALVHTIGERTVIDLLYQALNRTFEGARAEFIRAGLSGAAVLRLIADLPQPPGSPPEQRTLLLKISRDRGALATELSKYAQTERFPTQLFVHLVEPKVLESHDWYALAVRFLEDASTLASWIGSAPNKNEADVHKLCRQLFLEGGLGGVYGRPAINTGIPVSSAIVETLTPSRAARVRLAMKELYDLAKRHDIRKTYDPSMINALMASRRVGQFDEEDLSPTTYTCLTHGDLHAGNILVTRYDRPVLIDPANIEPAHWAADVSRLCVDILLRQWDQGYHSHEWDLIDTWIEVTQTFVNGNVISVDSDSENAAAAAFLNWISEHLPLIFPYVTPEILWEFPVALAVEFLRGAYRVQELPSPKRVWALYSASMAIHRADQMLAASHR